MNGYVRRCALYTAMHGYVGLMYGYAWLYSAMHGYARLCAAIHGYAGHGTAL